MGLRVPTSRKKSVLLLSLTTISVVSLLVLFLYPRQDMFADTYNPLTYNKDRIRTQDGSTNSKYDNLLRPVTPLFEDNDLQRRLLNNADAKGSVYTFFNDDKIRRLSIQEQEFHRGLLKKWVMLHYSLGFNVNVLHYNDAVENPRMKDMADSRVLFGKQDVINENYLKLLAWSQRMSTQKEMKKKGALYMDYTIFPASSKIDTIKKSIDKIREFQLLPDYEFQVMISDQNSLTELVDALIQKNKDFNIVESSNYGDIFSDYTVATWKKLLNTNNVKKVVETVPAILNRHIQTWRLAKYDVLNIVDPIAVGDHYFARGALQALKALLKCEDVAYPPPTRQFLDMFDREILPHLPERTTTDSDIEQVQDAERALKEIMARYVYKCPTNIWKIIITNSLQLEHRTFNLITMPHPLSTSSVLKYDDKTMITNLDLVSLEQRDLISSMLSETVKKLERVRYYASHRGNFLFFAAELLTVDSFSRAMSMHFGFDVPAVNDQFGVEYDDRSTSYSELSGVPFAISEGELKWKLDSVKALVANYDLPVPYVINQRQSENRLAQYRADLKLIKGPEKIIDPKLVLLTQNFESRHDPIVDIAEAWNPNDADLWWLIKSVRWLGNDIFKLLKEVQGAKATGEI